MDDSLQTADNGNTSLTSRLDNFWYHYKWHTLITLFFVLFIGICTWQMCSKQSYDVYVMYAGTAAVTRTTDDGTEPMYPAMQTTLAAFAEDRDDNGRVDVNFNTLYILSNDEIEAENQRRRELSELTGVRYEEVDAPFVKENLSVYQSEVKYGDFYICLLSETMYNLSRTSADGTPLFAPLAPYTEGTDAVLYASDAVLLSSTALGQSPLFSDLPEDTLLCLRSLSEVAARRSRNREVFAAAESTFRRMLG